MSGKPVRTYVGNKTFCGGCRRRFAIDEEILADFNKDLIFCIPCETNQEGMIAQNCAICYANITGEEFETEIARFHGNT